MDKTGCLAPTSGRAAFTVVGQQRVKGDPGSEGPHGPRGERGVRGEMGVKGVREKNCTSAILHSLQDTATFEHHREWKESTVT